MEAPPPPSVRDIILNVALEGGSEFEDPDSYQSRALQFCETQLQPSQDVITYYALACIYFASYGKVNKRTLGEFPDIVELAGWIDSTNWITNVDYCSWFGLTCNEDGKVQCLELPSNRLFGIVAPEVRLLAETLEILDLSNNYYLVSEPDSHWLGRLVHATHVNVGTTSLEYPGIPAYLGNLTNLQELDISFSFFSFGPISVSAFSGLHQLTFLDISNNVYTSTIPTLPTGLQHLFLDHIVFDENVTQTLEFVSFLNQLQTLWTDKSNLAGSLPTSFATTLTSLSLSFSHLTGTVPTELGRLTRLEELYLFQNNLTGSVPTELGQLTKLESLYLEGNVRLVGSISNDICVNIEPLGLLRELGADCAAANDVNATTMVIQCDCCTCCGAEACEDFS
jgi:Leucine-rich repeat (LRR) protein